MSRLIEWSAYLQESFGLESRFVTEDSGDWARALYHSSGGNPLGVYAAGENLTIIKSALWGKAEGFEVLIHELGHHLVYNEYFGYPGDWLNTDYFVKKYWRKVDKHWLKLYEQDKRREEMTVQCFALWAMDWGDQFEVNKGFKDFLIWINEGASPPPF